MAVYEAETILLKEAIQQISQDLCDSINFVDVVYELLKQKVLSLKEKQQLQATQEHTGSITACERLLYEHILTYDSKINAFAAVLHDKQPQLYDLLIEHVKKLENGEIPSGMEAFLDTQKQLKDEKFKTELLFGQLEKFKTERRSFQDTEKKLAEEVQKLHRENDELRASQMDLTEKTNTLKKEKTLVEANKSKMEEEMDILIQEKNKLQEENAQTKTTMQPLFIDVDTTDPCETDKLKSGAGIQRKNNYTQTKWRRCSIVLVFLLLAAVAGVVTLCVLMFTGTDKETQTQVKDPEEIVDGDGSLPEQCDAKDRLLTQLHMKLNTSDNELTLEKLRNKELKESINRLNQSFSSNLNSEKNRNKELQEIINKLNSSLVGIGCPQCSLSNNTKTDFTQILSNSYDTTNIYQSTSIVYRFKLINYQVWVPNYAGSVIDVVSYCGDIVKTIHLTMKPTALLQCGNQVLLGSDQGLYLMDIGGRIQERLHGGHITDVDLENDTLISYVYSNNSVLILKQACGIWSFSGMFEVKRTNQSDKNTVTLVQDRVYVSSYSGKVIDVYTTKGVYLRRVANQNLPANLWDPFLCGKDSLGNVLICNSVDPRLQMISGTSGEWSSHTLSSFGLLKDVDTESNHVLWVLWADYVDGKLNSFISKLAKKT